MLDTGDAPVPADRRRGRHALLATAGILTATAALTIGLAVAGRGETHPDPTRPLRHRQRTRLLSRRPRRAN